MSWSDFIGNHNCFIKTYKCIALQTFNSYSQGPFYRTQQLEGGWGRLNLLLIFSHPTEIAGFCWGTSAESYRMFLTVLCVSWVGGRLHWSDVWSPPGHGEGAAAGRGEDQHDPGDQEDSGEWRSEGILQGDVVPSPHCRSYQQCLLWCLRCLHGKVKGKCVLPLKVRKPSKLPSIYAHACNAQ